MVPTAGVSVLETDTIYLPPVSQIGGASSSEVTASGLKKEQPLPFLLSEGLPTIPYKAWVEELRIFLDREFVNFLIDGITVGFRIGYKCKGGTLVSATRNMLLAEVNLSVISEYLDKELRLGRVVGPLPSDMAVHVSRFGIVPKSSQPGKWWLIVDLDLSP